MKKNHYLFAVLFFQLIVINLFAQQVEINEEKKGEQEFILSAEIRPRLEYYHGYKQLAAVDQNHGLSISQRTRLNLDFKNSNFIVKLSLQDVRIWGNQEQLVANEDFATSIHEAWGEALISPKFSIKVGRQEIIYDDHRIFGNVDWAQQARSHDAALLKFKFGLFRAELALAYNQDGLNLTGTDNVARPSNYKTFQNIWMNYRFSEYFNASFLFLNNGMQIATGGDAYSQTVGPRLHFSNKSITANTAFYYQGGKDATTTKINASYFGADFNYKFNELFNAGFGFERLSGNSELEANNENNAFNPLYGTNHKFNGHMDYFYVGNHIGNVGLQDFYLLFNFKTENFSIGVQPHLFMAAADVEDPLNIGTSLSKTLGSEIDFYFGFELTKGVSFKGGYSQLFGTSSLEAIKGGDKKEISNWAYAMVIFKPTLFEQKK